MPSEVCLLLFQARLILLTMKLHSKKSFKIKQERPMMDVTEVGLLIQVWLKLPEKFFKEC